MAVHARLHAALACRRVVASEQGRHIFLTVQLRPLMAAEARQVPDTSLVLDVVYTPGHTLDPGLAMGKTEQPPARTRTQPDRAQCWQAFARSKSNETNICSIPVVCTHPY